jgi:sulfur carrier protein
MHVTVEVAGEDTHEVDVDEDATYADLLEPLDLSPHTVSVLVDDRTVPTDQPVESERVTVVRLIKGG